MRHGKISKRHDAHPAYPHRTDRRFQVEAGGRPGAKTPGMMDIQPKEMQEPFQVRVFYEKENIGPGPEHPCSRSTARLVSIPW